MTRFWRHSVLVLALGVVFYGLLMTVLCKSSFKGHRNIYYVAKYIPRKGGQEMYMMQDYDRKANYDVLVLGSSHAYRGYDPRIFKESGIDMFNAGSSSQSPQISLHLLHNHLEIQSGQVVLIDIYPVIFSIQGTETLLRWVVHDPSHGAATSLVMEAMDFRALNALAKRMICSSEAAEYEIEGYTYNGYCTIEDIADTTNLDAIPPFTPLETVCNDFKQLIAELKAKGAQVVLVNHPSPRPELEPSMLSFLDSLGLNTPFLDYTSVPGFSWSDFSDENHLNQSGVDKFNTLLISDLQEKGYLKP